MRGEPERRARNTCVHKEEIADSKFVRGTYGSNKRRRILDEELHYPGTGLVCYTAQLYPVSVDRRKRLDPELRGS